MKMKKAIAVALCLGMMLSSISGAFTGFAEEELSHNKNIKYDDNEGGANLQAPVPSIIELEPDIPHNNPKFSIPESKNNKSIFNSEVIFKGTKINYNGSPKDIYNLNKKDLEILLEQGYTIEDILSADELANKLLISPNSLLKQKTLYGMTFEELESKIQKEKKERALNNLKTKYKTEYNQLKKSGYKEEKIYEMLGYMDINGLMNTDLVLGGSIQSNDGELFKDKAQLSYKNKKKYSLTEKEAATLDDQTIKAMERLSVKTGKPVKELIKSLIKKSK